MCEIRNGNAPRGNAKRGRAARAGPLGRGGNRHSTRITRFFFVSFHLHSTFQQDAGAPGARASWPARRACAASGQQTGSTTVAFSSTTKKGKQVAALTPLQIQRLHLLPPWQSRHAGAMQCFAKCPFTRHFDCLSDQFCPSLDRLPEHFAKHWCHATAAALGSALLPIPSPSGGRLESGGTQTGYGLPQMVQRNWIRRTSDRRIGCTRFCRCQVTAAVASEESLGFHHTRMAAQPRSGSELPPLGVMTRWGNDT